MIETLLYYDQPEYDVFWEMVTELDVPIYLHPRSNIQQIANLEFQHAVWLLGPIQVYLDCLLHAGSIINKIIRNSP